MAAVAKLWECSPRTKAKLDILNNYLGAWFNILASYGYKHVIYVDGFCGPGEYSTGEIGSPVIAAKHSNSCAEKYSDFSSTLVFVDENKDALDNLDNSTEITKPHPNTNIVKMHGEFIDVLPNIIGILERYPSSPVFSFVDPFGFGDTPYVEIKKLMHNKSCEMFVNFMCGFMNRFKEHHDEKVTNSILCAIGEGNIDRIIEAQNSTEEFCEVYAEKLKELGPFVSKFIMRDEGNVFDNALFFCGRQKRGYEKMKEAMWRIDPIHGNSFSAYKAGKAENQSDLFGQEAYTADLSKILLRRYAGRRNVPVHDIFEWVVSETDTFLEKHARAELTQLHKLGKITYRDPEKPDAKKREGDWPKRLLIDFL